MYSQEIDINNPSCTHWLTEEWHWAEEGLAEERGDRGSRGGPERVMEEYEPYIRHMYEIYSNQNMSHD